MTRIDLNADLGEAFGRWRLDDVAMLDVVTSASVACGFHAGDPRVMRGMVAAAAARGVAIGAHPSYPDLVGFGRRELAATPDEIEADVIYQVGALAGVCAAGGARLRYVKPHGALYNRAARDREAADAIVRAVRGVDASLVLLALAGSEMERAGRSAGIDVAREAFIDRAYRADGTLVPRSEPGSVLSDVPMVVDRVLRMLLAHEVEAVDGTVLQLAPDSLCAHGDGPAATALVSAVRAELEAEGIDIAPFAA